MSTGQDLSGNLPAAPVDDLVIGLGRPRHVAPDHGVFTAPPGGRHWARPGRGMPVVPVDDIESDAGRLRFVAVAFGPGLGFYRPFPERGCGPGAGSPPRSAARAAVGAARGHRFRKGFGHGGAQESSTAATASISTSWSW
ncbi:hypothetical protein [Streptomyces sp. NPDC002133]|uniref:hypothetical protein n=1 Tax=Streptomyces sp. NPDC002133 TaxID=3154409 RepID=UPI00332B8DD0